MAINITELLKLVRANEVSCVVTESFENSVDIPKILSQKDGTRIWCSFPDITTVISLYTRLKKNKSISVDYVKQDDTYNDSSIVLSTSLYLKNKLMGNFDNGRFQKSSIDFCDIIVLGGTSLWTLDNTIIMNMWKCILDTKNDIKIPRLVLSVFNLELDTNIIPFDVSQSYFYIESEQKTDIKYHLKDWYPGDKELLTDMLDIVEKRHKEDDLDMKYLIYCPSFKDVVIFSSKLKTLDDIHIIFLTKDLDEKTAGNLNTRKKKDKRVVVISTSSLIPVQDVDVVFDCMSESLEYKTGNDSIKIKNVYIAKSIAEQRSNIASKYCYRMCSQEKFRSLKSQHLAESKRLPLTRTFLNIIDKGFNPSKFFGTSIMYNIIRDEMGLLKETKMIEEKNGRTKITKLGEFTINTGLSRYTTMLLELWTKTQQLWFPGIILACLIEKADAMYFFLPMKQKDQTIGEHDISVKKHFESYFKKWSSESILECYLNMWNAFADDIGTLKPSIEVLKNWCSEHSINFKTIYELLDLILQTFDKLEYMNRVQITIGKFSAKKLLNIANPMFVKVYERNICQLIDGEKYKYIDGKHENFFLDTRKHFNPYVRVPYKLFAFSKIVIKKERSEIRKIVFFHPVENKFLKDKRIETPIRKEVQRTQASSELFPRSKLTGYSSPYYPQSPEYNPDTEPSYIPQSPVYNPVSPEYNPDTEPSYIPEPLNTDKVQIGDDIQGKKVIDIQTYSNEDNYSPYSPDYHPDGTFGKEPEGERFRYYDIDPDENTTKIITVEQPDSVPARNVIESSQDMDEFDKAFDELEI